MFNPYHWYWRADDGRVFSSFNGTVGSEIEEGFVTEWPRDDAGDQTDAALQAVLTPYNITMG